MTHKRWSIRFFTGVAAVFFLLLCFTGISQAKSSEPPVRIGYVPDYCVITAPDSETEKGYGFEYFAEIAKYTGWNYEYIPCSWSEGMEMLESGQIDFLGPMGKNAIREEKFLYPRNSMGREYGGLFTLSNNTKISFNDPESLNGARVATEKDNIFNKAFEEYCAENDISVRLIYADARDFSTGLSAGEYDAIINGSMMSIPNTLLVAKLSIESFYFVTFPGNEDLRDSLDDAIEKIEMSNMYFTENLYYKYYKNNPADIPAFTLKEKDFIDQNPVIKVACDPSWAPIGYKDSQGYAGISVDILKETAKISGLKFEIITAADYQECKKLTRMGKVSLLLPHTEPAQELGVIYTDPYFQVSTILVGSGEIDPEKPLTVGVSNIQSLPAQALMKKYPQFQMVPYSNTNELLSALQCGREQYIFVNTYVYDEIVRGKNGSHYNAFPIDITFPLRFAVSLDEDPALLSILNKSIARLSEDRIESLVFANTVNRAYQMPFLRILQENIHYIILLLASFFIVFLLFILNINRKNRRRLERFAYVDSLTGLSTFAKFESDAAKIMKETPDSHFLLASLDVDNFKYINDVFGYETGNDFLKSMAEHFLKYPDCYKLVGRSNADNFLFLMEAGSKETAISQFSSMLEQNSELFSILPFHYKIVLSTGIYAVTNPDEPFASQCDKANIARKSVKGGHQNVIGEYTQDMDEQMQWKKDITLSMESSLKNGAFKVYIQPKYRLSDGQLAGGEALVRWQHPEKGFLSPVLFIPQFERNGFIVKIDFYMFRQICILLKSFRDKGLEAPLISVNLSRLHLSNSHLAADLAKIAAEYGVPYSSIEFELTESIIFDNTDTLIQTMQSLKDTGFHISIDDFGSGYSSLNLLSDLPVDVLKLDKGFLRKGAMTGNGQVILSQVISLAQKLHLSTVAEGIETKEQADFLRSLGCDLAQGFYYAKPMPYEEFEALL